jgi:hypothetical protein
MRWEDDNECWVFKNFEGHGRNIFLEFGEAEEKHEIHPAQAVNPV